MAARTTDEMAFWVEFRPGQLPRLRCGLDRHDVASVVAAVTLATVAGVAAWLVLRRLLAGGEIWYPDGGSPGDVELGAEVIRLHDTAAPAGLRLVA